MHLSKALLLALAGLATAGKPHPIDKKDVFHSELYYSNTTMLEQCIVRMQQKLDTNPKGMRS